jgi:hypothetical protein
MASRSIILGTINGISQSDFDSLKQELQDCFDKVGWKNNALFIKSDREHRRLKSIFTKISESISQGDSGSLLYVGDEKVACVYFGHKKFVGKSYREPRPPDWWIPNQGNQE